MSARDHDPLINEEPAYTAGLRFLRTELETAFTFVRLAEQAIDEDQINRNRENAQKACQSVCHFMGRIPIPEDENEELHDKLQELKGRLRTLEDPVE
jgi:hypothetical protein